MKQILIVEDIAETRRWLEALALEAFPEARIRALESLRAARRRSRPPASDPRACGGGPCRG